MKKAWYHKESWYNFGCLLTRFMRRNMEEEEELDYKSVVDVHPIDVTTGRSTGAHGPILTMFEHQTWTNEITSRIYGLQILQLWVGGQTWTNEITSKIYGLQMLQLRVGGRPATNEETYVVELDYPLGHYARILLRIAMEFVEPIDDDVPTDEERQSRDSDIELEDNEQPDVGDTDKDADDDDPNDDMAEA
ncbi:uncharacterized protein LOC107842802 [Capsicum annuum]|uniref:uncharacterized protein LOC107842802 n=1 Tax=Capsicum annuum TaxID=4072 RepID=UPI001FB139DD|nr:uncharacterized protein LOC107842802 [Capsicum annuum]